MNLTAWINQFISFNSTDGFLLDAASAALLVCLCCMVLSFCMSVISRVLTR